MTDGAFGTPLRGCAAPPEAPSGFELPGAAASAAASSALTSDALDVEGIRVWIETAAEHLRERSAEINALNVFPVADSDTGTNMALTLQAAAAALAADIKDGDVRTAGGALRSLATGAVVGARGNSGVIAAQLLRSLANAASGAQLWTAGHWRSGIVSGASDARHAVATPVDGTVLTVAHATASAVSSDDSFLALVTAAVVAGEEALARTPGQLAPLARAGVVDAGGLGWIVVLNALAEVLAGSPRPLAARVPLPAATVITSAALAGAATQPADAATRSFHGAGGSGYAGSWYSFEVQYLLDATESAVDALRLRLAGLGDSVVVVGTGTGTWNVHVHAGDVGAAIEAGVEAGRPHDIRIAALIDEAERAPCSILVALSPRLGSTEVFEAEGVLVADTTDPGDIAARVQAAKATQAVLLAPNAGTVAEAAAVLLRDAGLRVAVIPTRSPVQGLAAVAVHDATRNFEDDVVAMAEAAAATRTAEVSVAVSEALTSVGPCRPGDVLGLIDSEVVVIGTDVTAVTIALTDRLLGIGPELLTLLVGTSAPDGLGERVAQHVRNRTPLIEVAIYATDQSEPPLIIGVE